MALDIKQKRPISFGIKIGLTVISVSFVLGLLLKFTYNDTLPQATDSEDRLDLGIDRNILVPVIRLPINIDAHEKEWTNALARKLKGLSEMVVDRGRIDVLTDTYAIEIDFVKKWHEGLGQAIHYGDDSKRIGVLALIDKNVRSKNLRDIKLLKKIERLCLEKNIKLILLRSSIDFEEASY